VQIRYAHIARLVERPFRVAVRAPSTSCLSVEPHRDDQQLIRAGDLRQHNPLVLHVFHVSIFDIGGALKAATR